MRYYGDPEKVSYQTTNGTDYIISLDFPVILGQRERWASGSVERMKN
jgi:hypothetical protein